MPDEQNCEYCGGDHSWQRCKRISAIEHRPDGTVRIELNQARGGAAMQRGPGLVVRAGAHALGQVARAPRRGG